MIFKSNVMELQIINAVGFLTFKRLSQIPFINHAFSTRLGGISKGEFSHMNLAYGRNDSDENVSENYKIFCKAANFEYESLVSSCQTHKANVRVVTESDRGIGFTKPQDMTDIDALITNSDKVTLVTHYADCTPVYLVDAKNKAIGLIHSGWRGTVSEISRITLEAMQKNFSTDPKDVVAAIGPAIGMCCFEVDEPVANEFYKLSRFDTSLFVKNMGTGKYFINLPEVCKQTLLCCGVSEKNIVISDICTKCNSDLLFSHRATGGRRGGLAAFLKIK